MTFQFLSRRLRGFNLELVGRHPSDYAENLQEFLRDMHAQLTGGIPGGFTGTTPTTVLVGGTADPGTEAAGWMAANAQLVVARGTPVAIGFANSDGSSEEGAAADHVHDGTPILTAAADEARRQAWFWGS